MFNQRRVVISGTGLRTSNNPNILALTEVERERKDELSIRSTLTDPELAHITEMKSQILSTVDICLNAAHFSSEISELTRLGTSFGTYYGTRIVMEYIINTLYHKGPKWIEPWVFTLFSDNSIASAVSMAYHAQSASCTFMGLTASAKALCYAYDMIRLNQVDTVICVGYDYFTKFLHDTILDLPDFHHLQDLKQDQFGGIGVLLLESLEGALNRKATILAEVHGYSFCTFTNYQKEADLFYSAMQNTLIKSGIAPSQIDFVIPGCNLYGCGIDSELKAIKALFSDKPLSFFNKKIFPEFTLGASSVVELIETYIFNKTNPNRFVLLNSIGKDFMSCILEFM